MKPIRLSWMLVAILTSGLFFASCSREDDLIDEKQLQEAEFQSQLD